MKFKLGDFVRFVDEKREGYVTKVIDAQTLGVTDEDGFEIPVAISNLTSVHGHGIVEQKEDKDAGQKVVQVHIPIPKTLETGIYLAIAGDDKAGNVVHFHFQNQTENVLLISLVTERKEKYAAAFYGIAEPQTSMLIYSASLEDLELWPVFDFQILVHSKADAKPLNPLQIQKKFRAKDFSGEQKDLQQLRRKGWLLKLDEQLPLIDAQKLKESFHRSAAEKRSLDAPPLEVDLHIEKLRDDYHFLEADEILKIQLEHFQSALDAAIVHRYEKITFVHGSGNGTLRHQIHKILSQHVNVQSQKYPKVELFGYGATEVLLK